MSSRGVSVARISVPGIGGDALLLRLEEIFPGTTRRFAFPFLRIAVPSVHFAGRSDDEREELVATALDLDVAALRHTSNRLFLRFELLAPGEDPSPVPSRGETWLGMIGQAPGSPLSPDLLQQPVVHFYGFKGGQGRTTLLAFLANDLARDGLRVLVVDLDAEAPTLDLVLGAQEVPPEATLVGLRAELPLQPLSVATPSGGGSVALLAFRPSAEEYDLDAAALAFEAGVFSPSHEHLANQLGAKLVPSYDVVLVDHRTGLAPTVPAWLRALPGPIVVLDRLDGQSRRARRAVEPLWRSLPNPGLLVSYVPSNDTLEAFRERERGEAWGWLDALARAKSAAFPPGQEPLGPEDIEDHWVLWPDDNAFRRRGLPQRDEIGGRTRESIQRLRELLDLTERREHPEAPRALHPSGAADEGQLIATDALRKLCVPGSPFRFIIGRKGTGKTRLLRVLAKRSIGEPLVVAEDETNIGGLPSRDLALRDFVRVAIDKRAHEDLWWTLLAVALEAGSTDTALLVAGLQQQPELDRGLTRMRAALRRDPRQRVFLIDGLETMFEQEHAREFIGALLRVAASLENDKLLRSLVSLRIFLRTDIMAWGFQNFEQQAHGKKLELEWTTQAIFNFVLSRIPHYDWIAKSFPKVVADVEARRSAIEEGAVPEAECMRLLLRIFPTKLGRLNLNTATFLRTYFSDDPQGRESYYPRVYDKFLEEIDRRGHSGSAKLVSGRIDQNTIMRAHDEASKAFLEQVRQELRYLVPLDEDKLNRLLNNALSGERTPFVPKKLGERLKVTLKASKPKIDKTLEAMKEIGIFEEHPSLRGHWRVGRLFKSALGMIYKRG
jgi:CobQ/CobB/MinD/ParA nucleotide binding domain